MIKNNEISLAINTSDEQEAKKDGEMIRQSVLRQNIAYFNNHCSCKSYSIGNQRT